MIVHLRVVPGLWVAAEERRRPELCSHPVVIGGLPHQRGEVREANVVAQRCGVHAGMALSQAHQHCPDGIFLVPDLPYYENLWEAICDVLRRYTPLVEPLEMGQAVCDLSGCGRRWSDGWEMAHTLAQQVRDAVGIAPWLGIASNRLVAQLASTVVGADGINVVEAGEERKFLADLPITMLPDIDPRLVLTFQVLGLRTIGQFAALPLSAVKQRFGALGERLHRYARGIDERPVVPPAARPSIAARYQCEDGSLEEAVAAVHRLAEECAAELQRRGAAGMLVSLKLEWEPSGPPHRTPGPLPQSLPPTGESCLAKTDAASHLPLSHEWEKGPEGEGTLSIPYRIHSMLPQPGSECARARSNVLSLHRPATEGQANRGISPLCGRPMEKREAALVEPSRSPGHEPIHKTSVVVRTPIHTAPPLLERGQWLLKRSWPREDRRTLQAIELEVSEFEAPVQCSFAEFERLDQTGRLKGISPDRLQALVEQEQALTVRYGNVPFRHVAHLDPGNALTERRFRWEAGLPWDRGFSGTVGRPSRPTSWRRR